MCPMTAFSVSLKKTPQINSDLVIAALDDFALKKRHRYGTILIDAVTHKIVDMIESREKDDVIKWLKKYPNIKIFTRDGSSTYAAAMTEVLPDAMQVMDRFHILMHLTDSCKKFINRSIKASEPIEDDGAAIEAVPRFETKYDKIMYAKKLHQQGKSFAKISDELYIDISTVRHYVRISEQEAEKYRRKTDEQHSEESANAKEKMFYEIHTLHQRGVTQAAISRIIGTTEVTVSKYLKRNEPPRHAYNSQRKKEKIAPFLARINELGIQGLKSGEIVKILKAEGCTCSENYIRKNITEQRKLRFAPPKRTVHRKALISLLYHSLDKVKELKEDDLAKIIERYPLLGEFYEYIRSFKEIMFSKEVELLDAWMNTAEGSGISELNSFVNGVRQDLDATKAAIEYPYSNGISEGFVNKVKVAKRRMFGRCSFELLRAVVLNCQLS